MDLDPSKPPLGFRFNPTDEEIVEDFFIPMAGGGRLAFEATAVIHRDVDVYSSEPWNLLPFSSFKHGKNGNEAFFLVWRKPYSSRAVKDSHGNYMGCWYSKGRPKMFQCTRSGVKAKKTTSLVFKTPDGISTDWLMQEYSVLEPAPHFQQLALCKIYHNKEPCSRKSYDDPAMPSSQMLITDTSFHQILHQEKAISDFTLDLDQFHDLYPCSGGSTTEDAAPVNKANTDITTHDLGDLFSELDHFLQADQSF